MAVSSFPFCCFPLQPWHREANSGTQRLSHNSQQPPTPTCSLRWATEKQQLGYTAHRAEILLICYPGRARAKLCWRIKPSVNIRYCWGCPLATKCSQEQCAHKSLLCHQSDGISFSFHITHKAQAHAKGNLTDSGCRCQAVYSPKRLKDFISNMSFSFLSKVDESM